MIYFYYLINLACTAGVGALILILAEHLIEATIKSNNSDDIFLK